MSPIEPAEVPSDVARLAEEIAEWDRVVGLRDRLERIAATMACYGSVRSGRRLKAEEITPLDLLGAKF